MVAAIGQRLDRHALGQRQADLECADPVAQWEREAISDRTKEAMQHLKAKGVLLGAAPYGWKYTEALDHAGRRKLIEDPVEQAGIKRICELYETDMYVWQICEQLDAEKVPARGPHWHRATVYRVLRRAG